MGLRKLELILDEDDYNTVQAEIARFQASSRWSKEEGGGILLPEGESNLPGAIIAEIVRDLGEYRDLWEAEHPRRESSE